ncbi:MAG: hypothetical protein AAEF23_02790 [Gammaproteobacteria bacterium]
MFGFSFESWSEVTGAMYLGQGYEGTWTLIAVVVTVAILVVGAISEKAHYDKYK